MADLAVISLGGNVGNTQRIFKDVLVQLGQFGTIDKVSSVYETEPWGVGDQAWFKNQLLGFYTELKPFDLLTTLLQIEKNFGRDRSKEQRWGPRTLDLDIVLFGENLINDKHLEIPHPRYSKRRFILEPLVEIYPALIDPIINKTAAQILSSCEDKTQVRKLNAV